MHYPAPTDTEFHLLFYSTVLSHELWRSLLCYIPGSPSVGSTGEWWAVQIQLLVFRVGWASWPLTAILCHLAL